MAREADAPETARDERFETADTRLTAALAVACSLAVLQEPVLHQQAVTAAGLIGAPILFGIGLLRAHGLRRRGELAEDDADAIARALGRPRRRWRGPATKD